MLPYARPGIIGGCFLALGRALGETMAVTMLIGNRPDISLSPFAMGNSIASVIANEFTEATYDLYLSALVELGLVLLLVSMAVNSLARLLIWRVSGGGSGRSLFIWNLLFRERTPTAPTAAEVAEESAPAPGLPMPEAPPAAVAKPHSSTQSPVLWPASHHGNAVRVDRLMTGVLELCLVITVVPLFLILGYLIYRGVGALNWNFFVKLPAPVGQAGGGMANALYGSLLLVGLATLFAVPVGLFAAIYLAEYRSVRLGSGRPFHRRTARGRAVDRHRHLRLCRGREADGPLLGLGRGLRLGRHDDPDRHAGGRGGAEAGASDDPRRELRPGGQPLAT